MTTVLISALAALGLFTLCWFLFLLFLIPIGTIDSLEIRIFASDDAEQLEHILSGLFWLQRAGILEGHIRIVDTGLNERGRSRAAHLTHIHPGIQLLERETY